jgi:hypothetical protein
MNTATSSPKPRWKCRSCGNSAMFVREGSAVVHQLVTWTGREKGYRPFRTAPLVVKSQYEARPDYCWVCRSTDIGHARTVEGEHSVDSHATGEGHDNQI